MPKPVKRGCLAHTISSYLGCAYHIQPGSQRGPGLQEHAGKTQEVTDQLADASQGISKVPEQVDDGIHASAIAEIISDDNPS